MSQCYGNTPDDRYARATFSIALAMAAIRSDRMSGRRVDLDCPLGATERDIDDGAVERHQRCQRHYLVLVHICAVADAALERQPVMTVLDAPGPDDFERAVALSDREVEAIDSVASFVLVEQSWRVVAECGRVIKGTTDVGEETVDARHDGISGRTPDHSAGVLVWRGREWE